jgi:hypothetical protein
MQQRMAVALQQCRGLDCLALSQMLGHDVNELPLDVVLNHAREAAVSSEAVQITAERLLKLPDPLATLNRLFEIGLPTLACIEIAKSVIRQLQVVHPLAAVSTTNITQILTAFDVRVRPDYLGLQLWERRGAIRSGNTVLLLDLKLSTQTWLICDASVADEKSSEMRLIPLFAAFAANSQTAFDFRQPMTRQILDRFGQTPALTNPIILETPRLTIPPAYAVILKEPSYDFLAMLNSVQGGN